MRMCPKDGNKDGARTRECDLWAAAEGTKFVHVRVAEAQDLIIVHNIHTRGRRERGADLFFLVSSADTWGNKLKLRKGKI